MSEKGRLAKRLFEEGCTCAQAVLCAFHEELGLDAGTAMRLSSAFGGGMGRMREVCGAVSGMLMALGLKEGSGQIMPVAEKQALYQHVQRLAGEFRERNGSIICRELLSGASTQPRPEERTPEYYKKRPCGELVACAAELLEQYLEQQPE